VGTGDLKNHLVSAAVERGGDFCGSTGVVARSLKLVLGLAAYVILSDLPLQMPRCIVR
jgi:hypothetical protein